jgi:hypothetical protein
MLERIPLTRSKRNEVISRERFLGCSSNSLASITMKVRRAVNTQDCLKHFHDQCLSPKTRLNMRRNVDRQSWTVCVALKSRSRIAYSSFLSSRNNVSILSKNFVVPQNKVPAKPIFNPAVTSQESGRTASAIRCIREHEFGR